MKNKNLAILSVLGTLILLALVASLLVPKTAPVVQKDVNELQMEFEPSSVLPHVHRHGLSALLSPSAHAEEEGKEAVPTPAPLSGSEVRAYLVITVDNTTYSPLPLRQEGNYTIRQEGGAKVNVIHVTPDSVTMASSTCDNQLCVGEGTVTLDNKDTRILGGYIICLPNKVTLELYSAEEINNLSSAPSSERTDQ